MGSSPMRMMGDGTQRNMEQELRNLDRPRLRTGRATEAIVAAQPLA